eukprot:scaffold25549_cov69-Phaeocystis_antarctica.AAC.2
MAARAQELEQTGEARRVDLGRRGAVQQPAEQRAQLAHRVGLPVDREEVEVAVVRDKGFDVGLLAHIRARPVVKPPHALHRGGSPLLWMERRRLSAAAALPPALAEEAARAPQEQPWQVGALAIDHARALAREAARAVAEGREPCRLCAAHRSDPQHRVQQLTDPLLAHTRRVEDEQPKVAAPKYRSCRRFTGPRAAWRNAREVARQRIQSCPTSGDGRWCGTQNSEGEQREGHADDPASMLCHFDATRACKAFHESAGPARRGIKPQCDARSESKRDGNVAGLVHRERCDACDCEAQHRAESG